MGLDQALFATHGPRLALSIAAVPVIPPHLADFLEIRRALSEQLSIDKNRRFSTSAQMLGIFEPRSLPAAGRACRACGRDASAWQDTDDGRLCVMCADLEEVGRRLASARFLSVQHVEPYASDRWDAVFAALGTRIALRVQTSVPFDGAVFALDSGTLDELPSARFFPVGKAVPRNVEGEPLDFDAIASQQIGRPMLAVAKVDVDDLGITLQRQFEGGHPGPADFIAFSTFLSLFFEGYLNDRAASQDYPNIYMVYAGGDDMLCVGPLYESMRFLDEARRDFDRWTGANPMMHFSAGVSIADRYRPVLAGLGEAEALLAQSKRFRDADHAKDAVTIGDWTGAWQEFRGVLDLHEQLVGWLTADADGRPVARGLLRRLQQLRAMDRGDGTIRYGPVVWQAYYELTRFAERHMAVEADLRDIYKRALQPAGGSAVALAAWLAELATATTERPTFA